MEKISITNFKKINSLLKDYKQSKLMIVSKGRAINQIKQFIDLGHSYFGENRVQEAKSKFNTTSIINLHKVHLSLIGPLQSNKVKTALEIFDSIQTIDRIKLIDEIQRCIQTSKFIKTKEFFIQVNIGSEEQKNGVPLDDISKLVDYAQKKNIPIRGLMCIPPINENPIPYFKQMLKIKNSFNESWLLSMGMSNDYQAALENNSNIIRVGSFLFE